MNQAIKIRRLTFHWFDGLVQRIARARQDKDTLRWYLTISDINMKEIRAKYWKSTGENRADREENEEDHMEALLKSLVKSKDTLAENVLSEMTTLKKQLNNVQSKLLSIPSALRLKAMPGQARRGSQ